MFKKIIISVVLSILILSVGSLATLAYQVDPTYKPHNVPFSLTDEIKQGGASGATILILQIIAGALLYFAVPLAVIFILMAAFNMVIAGGESEKLDQAKKHLTWAIIGLICIILSYSIVKIIIQLVVDIGSQTADTVAPAAGAAGPDPAPAPPLGGPDAQPAGVLPTGEGAPA